MADVDLAFTTSGAAKVMTEQQRVKETAKQSAAEVRAANALLQKQATDIGRAFQQTLTPMEKLQQQAAKLKASLANGLIKPEDAAKAEQALKRINAQIEAMGIEFEEVKDTVDDLGDELDDLEASGDSAFGPPAVAKIGKYLAAIAGPMVAYKAITEELKAQQEIIDKQRATQLSVAASRDLVIRNMPGASVAERQRVLDQNTALATELGLGETFIQQARAQALSSTGGSIDKSLEVTRAAAAFLKTAPEDIGQFAGALADLQGVTNSNDAATNLGLLTAVGGASRVVDPRQVAMNVPKALIGAREYGLDASQGAALFSALTVGAADFQGAESATSTIRISQALERFTGTVDGTAVAEAQEKLARASERLSEAREDLATIEEGDTTASRAVLDARARLGESLDSGTATPEQIARARELLRRAQVGRDRELERARGGVTQAEQTVGAASTEVLALQAAAASQIDLSGLTSFEKLQAIRNNPELAEAFLRDPKLGVEAKQLGAVRSLLLRRDSKAAQAFDTNLRNFPRDNAALRAQGQQELGAFAANSLGGVAAVDRAIDSTVESLATTVGGSELTTEQLNKVESMLMTAGLSQLQARMELIQAKGLDQKLSPIEAADLLANKGASQARADAAFYRDYVQGMSPEQKELEIQTRETIARKLDELAEVFRQNAGMPTVPQ